MALGGKVPLGTYGSELVSAMARELEREESAPALAALESALDNVTRKGYCVFDRGIHDDVPDPGLVYLCSTYPAAVRLKDSLDSFRAQGNEPDCHTLGTYRMVGGNDYYIMGGLYDGSQADAYAVNGGPRRGLGAGEMAFRISDLKAKTFSYDVDADGERRHRRSSTTPTRGPTRSSSSGLTATGAWRNDNFLAENSIVEDLEQVYTGEISPVYLNRDIVDMEETAEAYGWVKPERTPASIAADAKKVAAATAAEKALARQGRRAVPAKPLRTPRPGTDTMEGADAPAGALAYTHKRSTAHPRKPIHPHPHICVKVACHDQERSEARRHGAHRATGRQHAIRSHDRAGGDGGPGCRCHELVFGADGRQHVELTTGNIRRNLGRPGFDTLL